MQNIKLTREQINQLPIRSFKGRIQLIREPDKLSDAVAHLSRDRVLGFDIEMRPSFRKGEKYPAALLQLAGADMVYIFRLLDLGLPVAIRALLSNPGIIKAGVSLKDDIKELRDLAPFDPGGFVDMGEAARKAGLMHHGLKGLAALLFGYRISKSAQRSNWANENLSEKQIKYAATDAWLSRELYFELLRQAIPLPVMEHNGQIEKGAAR